MIRITGGAWRGRTLPGEIPSGVRPTASRVREAVFSMVGQDLGGWSMLDLCGGAGLMALEAASRGASPVTVVDRSRSAIELIRRHDARLNARLDVRVGDARKLPLAAADLVYLDPPYADPMGAWLDRAASLTRRVLAAEAREGISWPDAAGPLRLDRVRTYGEASVALYVAGGAALTDGEAGADP